MYKVMLVDDEPLVRQYLRLHIQEQHPEWEIAADAMDGQEAWEKLQQEKVDLVITDIKMPLMDGIELCRLIHGMANAPQVMILSGYDEFALAQEAIRHGVRNYLLKPVVKEDLTEALDAVTSHLEIKNRESLAFFSQKSLSKESQAQVVKQFLKAVVSESAVEIKTLYPLIFRLKLQLIETEGVIMMLDLDEEQLVRKSIPYNDFMVFRFIVQQIAVEICGELGHGFVFLDEDQCTCVLVSGDDHGQILHRCSAVYRQVADAMLHHTVITVTGALGTMESELFHLHASYAAASRNLQQRLYAGEPALFAPREDGGRSDGPDLLPSLGQSLAAVRFALFDRNEVAYTVALKQYIEHMPAYTPRALAKFGIHMMKRLIDGKGELYGRGLEKAYRHLQRVFIERPEGWTAESVLAVYRDIACCFVPRYDGRQAEAADETDIASRAKAYIYTHYAEPLSLALLAEKLGVTPNYLSSAFHKAFQETYIKFLTRVRMEQAAKLLKDHPPEKVYDVADKVGYFSVKHFSHVFKQHYNLPPGEYQELHLSAQRRDGVATEPE
ncbi:MAG TPA: response regulator [Paenibacillus sp.]|uniref:response regulator n=1 Tax=Paenibacillus sp. TaxID=58172 RepID=UPI002BA9B0AA|nr:response regulator [Paenibacillus sp.]HUC94318.1 response regulator [Paenibacillus sp.]